MIGFNELIKVHMAGFDSYKKTFLDHCLTSHLKSFLAFNFFSSPKFFLIFLITKFFSRILKKFLSTSTMIVLVDEGFRSYLGMVFSNFFV